MLTWILLGLLVSWDPCVDDVAGNPEDGIEGYTVFWGEGTGQYTHSIDVGNVTSVELPITISAAKTYYFAATCTDISGNESALSDEVIYSFKKGHKYPRPRPPIGVTVVPVP